MQLPMGSDDILYQGPIMLERALFCLDCEVIFTGLASCPSCSGRVVWPLAQWLSPAPPHLPIESRPAPEGTKASRSPRRRHTLASVVVTGGGMRSSGGWPCLAPCLRR